MHQLWSLETFSVCFVSNSARGTSSWRTRGGSLSACGVSSKRTALLFIKSREEEVVVNFIPRRAIMTSRLLE
jgi:hypothetical protein